MKKLSKIIWGIPGFIIIIVSVCTNSIYAQQPGTLDSTFGNNGVVFCGTNFAPLNGAFCLMDDQERIISVSNFPSDSGFVIMRHTIDGSIDSTFGLNGSIAFYPGIICACHSVEVDVNNRLIVGGFIQHLPDTLPFNWGDFFIARFLPIGSPDSTFGIQGYISFDLGEDESVNDITIQNDSLILLSGSSGHNIWGSGNTDVALIRLFDNGTLDSSFGTNGIVITDLTASGGDQDHGKSLATQPDGKILQTAANGPGISVMGQLCLLRYQYNGMLDSSFANNGIAIDTINGSNNSDGKYIGMKNDGSIIVACNDGDFFTGGYFYSIRQFTSSGFLDSAFANNGIIESQHQSNGPEIYAVQIQSDNKIVAITNEYDTVTSGYFSILNRFTSQGLPDVNFGTAGKTLLSVNCLNTSNTGSIYLKPIDKITLLGETGNSIDTNLVFISRYYNDINNGIHSETNEDKYGMVVYPNPANYFITVEASVSKGKTIVSIFNISGQKISEQQIIHNKAQIDLSNLASGVYVIKLQNEKTVAVGKLFKE